MKTNNLIYKATNTRNNQTIDVKVRLNDECKNGHQDFAITATIWQAGKPKVDKYMLGGGCCHEEIIKHFPNLKIFVDLHLCDYSGAPMYPSANGFYHLTNGFNNTPIDSPKFKKEYCEYYRITTEQFDVLKTAKNKIQFSILLDSLGILNQWKEQANKAIKYLEELTGDEFLNDSKRSQHTPPTPEELEEERIKQETGYYSAEAELKREQSARNKEIEKLQNELNTELNKHRLEYEVKKTVLEVCGTKALENCIFYNHTKQLTFNWRTYEDRKSVV